MRTLAFDGRMGAAGDMILGALLAAGADSDVLTPVEDALGVEYRSDRVTKNGIRATRVDVLLPEAEQADTDPDETDEADGGTNHDGHHGARYENDRDKPNDDHDKPNDDHDHRIDDQDHQTNHYDHHHPERGDDHTHAEGHGPSRTFPEVLDVVDGMDLPAGVRAEAEAVFRLLGEAEAAVHGTDLEGTHFHEVGADDAIADVVGACLLLDDLDPERVVTTPLATGGGEVEMSHGRYPVPTPAVVNLAARADWELRGGPVETELLTPTGAAILAHVADGVESLPSMNVETSGYGAGGYDFPAYPNVLRALLGEARGGLAREPVRVLETNLDDATPEVLGGLQETLSDAGARDVTVVPTTMKKSRPGHLVKVVVGPEDAERVARRLAEETGTLGVRDAGVRHRWIADRESETVELAIDGRTREVAVKVASDAEGEVYDVSAEYDDAAAVARESGLPIREVMQRAESAVRERFDG